MSEVIKKKVLEFAKKYWKEHEKDPSFAKFTVCIKDGDTFLYYYPETGEQFASVKDPNQSVDLKNSQDIAFVKVGAAAGNEAIMLQYVAEAIVEVFQRKEKNGQKTDLAKALKEDFGVTLPQEELKALKEQVNKSFVDKVKSSVKRTSLTQQEFMQEMANHINKLHGGAEIVTVEEVAKTTIVERGDVMQPDEEYTTSKYKLILNKEIVKQQINKDVELAKYIKQVDDSITAKLETPPFGTVADDDMPTATQASAEIALPKTLSDTGLNAESIKQVRTMMKVNELCKELKAGLAKHFGAESENMVNNMANYMSNTDVLEKIEKLDSTFTSTFNKQDGLPFFKQGDEERLSKKIKDNQEKMKVIIKSMNKGNTKALDDNGILAPLWMNAKGGVNDYLDRAEKGNEKKLEEMTASVNNYLKPLNQHAEELFNYGDSFFSHQGDLSRLKGAIAFGVVLLAVSVVTLALIAIAPQCLAVLATIGALAAVIGVCAIAIGRNAKNSAEEGMRQDNVSINNSSQSVLGLINNIGDALVQDGLLVDVLGSVAPEGQQSGAAITSNAINALIDRKREIDKGKSAAAGMSVS